VLRSVTPGKMLLRGLGKRCPFCGSSGLFEGWFRMKPSCPACKHHFSQEEGFFLGAYALNFAITEGLLLLCLIPYIVLSSANPTEERAVLPFVIAALVAAVAGPIVFYPFSRTLWVALDLMVRGGRNLEK
jgi:uncharacterized protein (DUF983 family)